MINCATVPTTISVKAVEILNQMANKVAISAKPTHKEANTQTFCMAYLVIWFGSSPGIRWTPGQDPQVLPGVIICPGSRWDSGWGRTPSPVSLFMSSLANLADRCNQSMIEALAQLRNLQ
jgi:hypothetical protein